MEIKKLNVSYRNGHEMPVMVQFHSPIMGEKESTFQIEHTHLSRIEHLTFSCEPSYLLKILKNRAVDIGECSLVNKYETYNKSWIKSQIPYLRKKISEYESNIREYEEILKENA